MSSAPRVEVIGLEGIGEIEPGHDLAATLAPPLRAAGARDGDVVVVTSKIVSKAEGRLVAGNDRSATIAAETRRVVARRGDLIIAETRHGFVCANAGVDASNLDPGIVAMLPLDPDGTARALHEGVRERLDVRLGVLITDTFGRAWRTGVVNVAIGCAGLPGVVDLRGRPDDRGRPLDSTVVALADEVAAASGLVMAKDARVPAALIRGVDRMHAPDGRAVDLIRPAAEDLFRASVPEVIRSMSDGSMSAASSTDGSSSSAGTVERGALLEAIEACAQPWPADGPARRFTVIDEAQAIEEVMRTAGSGIDDAAPGALVVPWLRAPAASETDRGFAAGACVHAVATALSAAGLAVRWVEAAGAVTAHLGAGAAAEGWDALGALACGPLPKRAMPRP